MVAVNELESEYQRHSEALGPLLKDASWMLAPQKYARWRPFH